MSEWKIAIGMIEDAVAKQAAASRFNTLNYYIPTLERLLAEHQADRVNDHNLKIQHDEETPVFAAQLQTIYTLRDALAEKGYRVGGSQDTYEEEIKARRAEEIKARRAGRAEGQARRAEEEARKAEGTGGILQFFGIFLIIVGFVTALSNQSAALLVLSAIGGAVALVGWFMKV